ncbi:MAG: hypothetical protein Q9193_007308, partial [Seirophora villosa]
PELHSFFPKHMSLRRVLESAFADTFLSPAQLTYALDTVIDTHLRWFEPELNPNFQPRPNTSSNNSKHTRPLRHGPHTLDLTHSMPPDWADQLPFGALPFGAQRLALLLRALLRKPDLVVLDEAFSGMDALLRDKALLFLQWGTTRRFTLNPNFSAYGDRARLFGVRGTPAEVLAHEGLEVQGLEERQALVVVSHVKEEVPGSVRDWMCLPEAETGKEVRMGRFTGPLEGVRKGWERIWEEDRKSRRGRQPWKNVQV